MSTILVVSHDHDFMTQLSESVGKLSSPTTLLQAKDISQAAVALRSETFEGCLIDNRLALLEGEPPDTDQGVKLAMLLEKRHPKLPIFLLSNLEQLTERRVLGANLERVFCLNRPRTQDEFRALASKISQPHPLDCDFVGRREVVIFDERSNVVESYGSSDDLDRASLNATLRFNSKQIGQAFLEELPKSIEAIDSKAKLSLTFTAESQVLDYSQEKSSRPNVLSPELLHAVLPKEHLANRGAL